MRKETEDDNVFQIARGNPGFLRYSLTRSLIAILPNRDVIGEYRTVVWKKIRADRHGSHGFVANLRPIAELSRARIVWVFPTGNQWRPRLELQEWAYQWLAI